MSLWDTFTPSWQSWDCVDRQDPARYSILKGTSDPESNVPNQPTDRTWVSKFHMVWKGLFVLQSFWWPLAKSGRSNGLSARSGANWCVGEPPAVTNGGQPPARSAWNSNPRSHPRGRKRIGVRRSWSSTFPDALFQWCEVVFVSCAFFSDSPRLLRIHVYSDIYIYIYSSVCAYTRATIQLRYLWLTITTIYIYIVSHTYATSVELS